MKHCSLSKHCQSTIIWALFLVLKTTSVQSKLQKAKCFVITLLISVQSIKKMFKCCSKSFFFMAPSYVKATENVNEGFGNTVAIGVINTEFLVFVH